MSKRPEINEFSTGAEFADWYWLKEELVDWCRAKKMPYTGSKQQITDRIAHFIDTGEVLREKSRPASSSFDWHKEKLTPATVITDSYRNSQNVRRFFKEHYGEDFAFNIAFMSWMKENTGKTLADAVEARRKIAEKAKTEKSAIPTSNQYNRYTREFFTANPGRKIADARTCWTYKRGMKGHNRYEDSDLIVLDPGFDPKATV